MAGSSIFKVGATASTKKYRNPNQRKPATMCIHRNEICSTLAGLAANATSSFQSANESDQAGHSTIKAMTHPSSCVSGDPTGNCMLDRPSKWVINCFMVKILLVLGNLYRESSEPCIAR